MGVFSFIETFFFISLGITFVLILLLVYHFKQRLTSIEQKGNTMFEIINNIVKEIGLIKRDCFQCMMPQSQPPLQQQFFAGNSCPVIPVNKITLDNIPEYNPTMEDEMDSESDDESVSGSETSSGTDTDDEDDEDDDEIQNVSIQQKIVVSDNEESDNDNDIKIINIDINESIQLVEELPINDEPTEVEVTKIEESATVEPNKPDRMAIYNNMSLSELKAKVIELGLSTEPAKMKRPKLLSMLEASLL
jgi:hypothetical protein